MSTAVSFLSNFLGNPESFKVSFFFGHLFYIKTSSHLAVYLDVYKNTTIIDPCCKISLEVKYFYWFPFCYKFWISKMGLWPVQWYGGFFHISIFSRDYKNSRNGKDGPLRSQTTLISSLNQIMWHKIAISISILIIILNATVIQPVLKWNFLLPHRRRGFPFLRFFVSQLEPTRNLTPTYNHVIQIHNFWNFPEVQCFGSVSGTYSGNTGSFRRKYPHWKKERKRAFLTTIQQSQWIIKFLVWTVLPADHWSICQCIRPVLPLV